VLYYFQRNWNNLLVHCLIRSTSTHGRRDVLMLADYAASADKLTNH
jgi:hypothetical protein